MPCPTGRSGRTSLSCEVDERRRPGPGRSIRAWSRRPSSNPSSSCQCRLVPRRPVSTAQSALESVDVRAHSAYGLTEDGHRVTAFEIFFDLVFVFAFTRVISFMVHDLTPV